MYTGPPAVELADHGHGARVRRPHREAHAGDTVDFRDMRTELLPEAQVRAFGEPTQVLGVEERVTHDVGAHELAPLAGPRRLDVRDVITRLLLPLRELALEDTPRHL